jgi:FKBP12-rapamycin complex-associated protein
MREASFCQLYGSDLREAWALVQMHISQTDPNETVDLDNCTYLRRAWDLYLCVFKRINLQIPQIQTLELVSCSPNLLQARDLDLGVPGTYSINGQATRIRGISPVVVIIRSKQRPRRIKIFGEDGQTFIFLLKVKYFFFLIVVLNSMYRVMKILDKMKEQCSYLGL